MDLMIKSKLTGHVVSTTAESFALLTNAAEWDIVEPETQETPVPDGQAIRASTLQPPVVVSELSHELLPTVATKKAKRK